MASWTEEDRYLKIEAKDDHAVPVFRTQDQVLNYT